MNLHLLEQHGLTLAALTEADAPVISIYAGLHRAAGNRIEEQARWHRNRLSGLQRQAA